jgi:hypothetical protein
MEDDAGKLGGEVERHETFIGGKPATCSTGSAGDGHYQGRSMTGKVHTDSKT